MKKKYKKQSDYKIIKNSICSKFILMFKNNRFVYYNNYIYLGYWFTDSMYKKSYLDILYLKLYFIIKDKDFEYIHSNFKLKKYKSIEFIVLKSKAFVRFISDQIL